MIPRFFEMGKKGRLLVVIAALFITGSEFYFSRGDLSSPGLLVIPIILAGLGFSWKQGWVVVPVSLCIAVLRDLFFIRHLFLFPVTPSYRSCFSSFMSFLPNFAPNW